MTYDVIVVGARCAGSPTAMLLARRGSRVLLVDRARFPSDTMSTHWIHQPGVEALRRWGLLEALVATGCPPIHTIKLDFGPFAIAGAPLPADGTDVSYAPRRTVLDALLVDAAVAAGAEFREEFTVDELVWDDGRVVGIRGRSPRSADAVTEQARLVVGADGLHSMVARAVAAPVYYDRGVRQAAYYTYWSGVPTDGVEVYVRDRRSWGLIPTHDGLTVLPLGWPIDEFEANRSDIEGNYLATLEQAPEVAERVRAGRREARFMGSGDLRNFFRKPCGPGWALVGDAGEHMDPCTAQGISAAFQDAETLAHTIHRSLAGGEPMNIALGQYEKTRNASRLPVFDFTCQLASLEPPAREMQQLLAAVHDNPEASRRFVSLIAGTQSFEDFFAPDAIQRLMVTAAVTS